MNNCHSSNCNSQTIVYKHIRDSAPIMSLDFHPKKTDLFCFCDHDNVIQYWITNPFSCTRSLKGGTAQVRFQPRTGQLLTAASDKIVSIYDVETDRQTHSFQGHSDMVNYICWHANGEYLASVSQNLVKIWSLSSGECIQELSSDGNQFHSCVFHPSYSTLLVIGGISSLELWNMAENKSMTVAAHENIISALAQSPYTGMVASASYDGSVKLWKKRKQHSSCGPANSTGIGNTVSPSPRSPASTRTPGDGIKTANSTQHVNRMPKSLMMYGLEGTGLAASSNLLDDIERFGNVGSLEDNVESFLSNDGGDRRDLYVTLKQSLKQPHKDSSEGNLKFLHFSSDGKLLACAGHDKKPICCLQAYRGQNSPIMSLDFHPKKTDSFCFCDHDNEIRCWDINPFFCTRSSKGGTAQVRFQPRTGQLLAAASDKIVSIFDVEQANILVPDIGDPTLGNEVFKNADGSIRIKFNSSGKFWRLAEDDWIYADSDDTASNDSSTLFWPSL